MPYKDPVKLLQYQKDYRIKKAAQISAQRKAHYRANRERMLAAVMRYKTEHHEEIKAKRRKHYRANTRLYRNQMYRRFGITVDHYDAMFKAQSGRCAICCSKKPYGHARHFYVDHCHKTKKVRGLLCMNCNQGIGKFKDSPRLLLKAIVYLRGNHVRRISPDQR